MGTGYVRNDTGNNIADGNVINASDLDGEFDAIVTGKQSFSSGSLPFSNKFITLLFPSHDQGKLSISKTIEAVAKEKAEKLNGKISSRNGK